MPTLRLLIALCCGILMLFGLTGCDPSTQTDTSHASEATSEAAKPKDLSHLIPHFAQPGPKLLTGGQPDASAWPQMAKQGVTRVINLRSSMEKIDHDEAKAVTQAGMTYIHLPISGASDITAENADKIGEFLAASHAADGKTLIHCASGNRVGALIALNAAQNQGVPIDDAIKLGRVAGLRRLEGTVREKLKNEAK